MIGSSINGRYRLEAELGHGGMGVVYRARDTILDRDVALKVVRADVLGAQGRARLLREAQAAAKLNHPNIAAVYDAGQAGDLSFIVMELVAGESLHDRPPQALSETLAVARQVCAALEHAHAHGIVHRDLKPENVLIGPDGTAKLMDFGLARSAASRLTAEGALVGTAYYLAPEQALGQEVDGRADLYALGVMLYELATGQLPFEGKDALAVVAQHLHGPPAPPRSVRPELPPELEAVILRLLAKQPVDRYQTAREVAMALAEIERQGWGTPEEGPGLARESGPPPVAAPDNAERDRRRAAGVVPNNLPVQLSSFVGREREMEEIKRWLDSSRLVTLTGAGGTGKTRLALEVAGEMLDGVDFPDGVWLVELAPLFDAGLVPQEVASVLGVREQAGRPLLETLSDYVRPKRLLLLLDNCEHLIEASARLAATLLRASPGLKILATSREPIGLTGERAWAVPTLSAPGPLVFGPHGQAPHQESLVSRIAGFESVRLFVDRARAVQAGFDLTEENAAAVAQICARLDGIPLAIELAAARMRALTVEQIAARLDDRFSLLTLGSRSALPRHQTLRATIDWSYELLTSTQQRLLYRLSAFANGWTLEAAEHVCAGDRISPAEVLDLLTNLVDKSLVLMEESGSVARYRLLATIRQYLQEKLQASGELERVRSRHLEFFMNLALRAEPELRGAGQLPWLETLEVEHDNLRAALDWAMWTGADGRQSLLLLAGSLALFWYLRGYWRMGREWLRRSLSMVGGADEAGSEGPEKLLDVAPTLVHARARALMGAGWLEDENGQEEMLYSEALALSRQAGDLWGEAFSLRGCGVAAYNRGDRETAAILLNESLALFRQIKPPDRWGIGLALFNLGWLAFRSNDYPQAAERWQASLSEFRATGDRWGAAVSLSGLGYLARVEGDYSRAAALSKQSLDLFRELGDKAGISESLSRLGNVALQRDDYRQATTLFEESLIIQVELGQLSETAYATHALGLITAFQGDYAGAVRLLEQSLDVWQASGYGWGIAAANDGLGVVAYYQGDRSRAADLWETSLAHFREAGDRRGTALVLSRLGQVALSQGDHGQAAKLLAESLQIAREVADRHAEASALAGLGRLAQAEGDLHRAEVLFHEGLVARQGLSALRAIAESLEDLASLPGQPERTALLLGAAEALREALGAPLPPVDRERYEATITAARAGLGKERFEAVRAKGRALKPAQAVQAALKGVSEWKSAPV